MVLRTWATPSLRRNIWPVGRGMEGEPSFFPGLDQKGRPRMKNDKPHSIQKYWFILLCWFTSPMLLKTFLGITISKEVLAFGDRHSVV